MRTVTFKSVFEGILRRHGMDPRGDAVSSDAGLALVEHINARVKRAWFAWEWPEWTITEERAYRQIWNDSRQFYQAGGDGKPDEVFYIPNVATSSLVDAGYYRVAGGALSNPPIGTPPTDTVYWEKLDSVDAYIAFDQVCRRRIGEVLSVYGNNPAVVKPPREMGHRVNQNGAQVYEGAGLLTVFVRYLTPAEKFTTFPYIGSRTYLRGDVVYVPEQGECYQALQVTTGKDPVTETSYWRQCLMPEVLAQYVKAGAFSDSLRESDTSDERDPVMLQLRGQQSAAADAEAEDELNRQINRLQAQGQNYSYLPFGVMVRRSVGGAGVPGVFWSTPAYVLQGAAASNYGPLAPTGEGTTTLSDQCETEWGYIPPAPPAVIVKVPIANQRGSVQLVVGQSYVDVVFHSTQTNANWILVACEIVNTTDASPLNISPGIITSRTLTGFRVQLNGLPDTGNYFLQWAINGNVIPPAPATTYNLSGPTSGLPGSPSTFTVELLPDTMVPGLLTITPNSGGDGGTFSPASVTLTTDAPSATFIYTPASYGNKMISVINDGGLTDPAPIILNIPTPTYSLTGPGSGSVGVPSTPFTVTLSGAVAGPVTVTPSAGGGGGTFTPATVALTTAAPSATFTYTPASAGTKTINVTNNGGLTNPGSISYLSSVPFVPTDIAGLKMWLKADAIGAADGASVTAWNDSSPNGYNLNAAGCHATYKTNIVNGKPVLRFNGTSDLFYTTATSGISQPNTVFAVAKQTAPSANEFTMFRPQGATQIMALFSDGRFYLFAGAVAIDSVDSTGAFHVFTGIFSGGNGTGYIDGVLKFGPSPVGSANVGQVLIMAQATSGGWSQGDCAEILLYNSALSPTDRANVENYLKAKYGL